MSPNLFIVVAASACTLILAQPASAQRIEDFYGIWVDEAQAPFDCAEAEGEGPWITIGPKLYLHESGDGCDEVEMFLKGGKLRVSASCEGHEEGFTSVNAEYSLNARGRLTDQNGVNRVRCRGPIPKWVFENR